MDKANNSAASGKSRRILRPDEARQLVQMIREGYGRSPAQHGLSEDLRQEVLELGVFDRSRRVRKLADFFLAG